MKTIITILLFLPFLASASGIEVSPAKLELSASKDKPSTQKIVVANPTSDIQLFEVYTEDFGNIVHIMPASFTLEAGGRKSINVALKPKSTKSELLTTNIAVLSKPLINSSFTTNTGIKIPTTITITEQKAGEFSLDYGKNFIFLVIVGLVLISLIYKFLKARKYI